MEIEINRVEKELTIKLTGKLDTSTVPELESELKGKLEGIKKLIFDFSDLDYISSAGLRVVLSSMKSVDSDGETILRGAKSNIIEVFELTGLINYLKIE